MHFSDEWMALVVVPNTSRATVGKVPVVDLFDSHHREDLVPRIEQGDFAIEFRLLVVGIRQRDGYREKMSVAQSHFCYDAIVILAFP